MDDHALEARLLVINGEIREEFGEDDHYVGLANNHPLPYFHVAVGCQIASWR